MPNAFFRHARNYPVGGEDIDVFIELRVLGIRLMIMTDEVVIVIDIP